MVGMLALGAGERVGLELGRRWKLFIPFQRLMLETGVCYLVVRRKKGRINRSSSDLIRCGLSFVALQCEFFSTGVLRVVLFCAGSVIKEGHHHNRLLGMMDRVQFAA